jgi:hypothetical protein
MSSTVYEGEYSGWVFSEILNSYSRQPSEINHPKLSYGRPQKGQARNLPPPGILKKIINRKEKGIYQI